MTKIADRRYDRVVSQSLALDAGMSMSLKQVADTANVSILAAYQALRGVAEVEPEVYCRYAT